MADTQLTLSAQEQEFLVKLLETALKNHRVEEHRTRTPSYREGVIAEEKILEQILTKLGRGPAQKA